jgi:hypothetical protein
MTKRFNEAISYSPKEERCYTRCGPSRRPRVGPGSACLMAQPTKLAGGADFLGETDRLSGASPYQP